MSRTRRCLFTAAMWMPPGSAYRGTAASRHLFKPFYIIKHRHWLRRCIAGDNADRPHAPYLTAELGGGLQVTAHRRPCPYPEDTEAQALCALGSGANLIGYYMYHGGYNPDGRYSTLQESKATGYYNDYPVKSYDFQACIRESGLLNASYGKLKKLHLFINDFQEILAPADAYLPDIQPQSPEDLETVRAAVRHNHETGEGFLFINNHQRKRVMKAHKDWSCSIDLGDDKITLEHIDIAPGECLVIPYHLRMGNALLLRTNASSSAGLASTMYFTPITNLGIITARAGLCDHLKHQKQSGRTSSATGWLSLTAFCTKTTVRSLPCRKSLRRKSSITCLMGPAGLRWWPLTQAKCEVKFTYLGTGEKTDNTRHMRSQSMPKTWTRFMICSCRSTTRVIGRKSTTKRG